MEYHSFDVVVFDTKRQEMHGHKAYPLRLRATISDLI